MEDLSYCELEKVSDLAACGKWAHDLGEEWSDFFFLLVAEVWELAAGSR